MNKWMELLLGLILVLVPVILVVQNSWGLGLSTLEFLKGAIMWIIFVFGLLFIILGISDLKS